MKQANWQIEFWKVIEESRQLRWAWGTHDCVTFAAKCLGAQRGVDGVALVHEAFGEWSNEAEAVAAINGDLTTAISAFIGSGPVPWTKLTMGDIVLIRDDEGKEVVTVHDGFQLVCPMVPYGLHIAAMNKAIHGWKI